MVVNMAQFEREQTSERVSINCHSRAVRGLVNGGRAILGYDRHSEKNSVLVVNEDEAKEVRLIFEIFLEQGSISKTLNIVNEMGISTKRSMSEIENDVEKKSWSHTTLKVMLSNIAYVGLKEVNKKNKNSDTEFLKPWQRYQVVKAAWPRIISQDLFDEVQRVLKDNESLERRRLKNAEHRIFLLSQRIYCNECGARLHGHSAHGRNEVYRHYTHAGKMKDVVCSFKRVRADKLEEVVVKHLTTTILSAGYLEKIEEKLIEAVKDEPNLLKERLSKIQKSVASVDLEISGLIKTQAQLKRSTSIQLMEEELEKLSQRRENLFTQLQEVSQSLENIKESSTAVGELKEQLIEFKKGYAKAPPAIKRRLLRAIIKEVGYGKERVELSYFLSEERAENVVSINRARKIEKRQILGAEIPPVSPLKASGSDLSLLFAGLRDGLNWMGNSTIK